MSVSVTSVSVSPAGKLECKSYTMEEWEDTIISIQCGCTTCNLHLTLEQLEQLEACLANAARIRRDLDEEVVSRHDYRCEHRKVQPADGIVPAMCMGCGKEMP